MMSQSMDWRRHAADALHSCYSRMSRPIPNCDASASVRGPLSLRPGLAVVTGGAGFIGSHLVELLLQQGYSVHVVDDLSTGRVENLATVVGDPKLTITVGSVADARTADGAIKSADVVFHLAGVVGVRRLAEEPLDVMQANLHSTEAVLRSCAAHSVPVLVTSSSEVYGDGPVPFEEAAPVRPGSTEGLRGGYACAKAMGEWLASAHAEQSGLPVLVARLFNTVGPRQSGDHGMVLPRFVRQAMRGEPMTVYGGGEQTRCFAHVRDVARALLGLATSARVPGRVVNVGSAIETPVLMLAEMVRAAADSSSPVRNVPFGDVFPEGFVDPPRRVPSLDRLRAANGWVPEMPLASIVSELIALFVAQESSSEQEAVVEQGAAATESAVGDPLPS
jgi:UDP-glucose 4-epimerase